VHRLPLRPRAEPHVISPYYVVLCAFDGNASAK
jgi:hypothetical protein